MPIEIRDAYELPIGARPQRPIAVFADLHMSDRSAGDPFGAAGEAALLEALDGLPGGCVAVFAGDTFDEVELDGSGRGFLAIREHYGLLLAELARRRVVYIRGNHDLFLALDVHLLRDTFCSGRLLIQHGHQADPLNESPWSIGAVVSRINGLGERLLGWKAEAAWAAFRAETRRWSAAARRGLTAAKLSDGEFSPDPYRVHAEHCLMRASCGCAIWGHTHRLGVWQSPQGLLVNLPDWTQRIFALAEDEELRLLRVAGPAVAG